MVGEMTLVCKTGFGGNLADGKMTFRKKSLGVVDAALDHVLMNRHADGFAECRVTVGYAHTSYPGDFFERELAAEIIFDVREYLPQTVSRHS